MYGAQHPEMARGVAIETDPEAATGTAQGEVAEAIGTDPEVVIEMDIGAVIEMDLEAVIGMDPEVETEMDPEVEIGMDPEEVIGTGPEEVIGMDPGEVPETAPETAMAPETKTAQRIHLKMSHVECHQRKKNVSSL